MSSGKPSKSILDRSFAYTPAARTDLRELFNRIQPGWNKPKEKQDELAKRRKQRAG